MTKINSLIEVAGALVPVEVELTLLPGLPQIMILGLPDRAILESSHRVKCALKKQGFEFPKSQQILVNIRPGHLKKTSRGIDLAIAAAYLWETEQLPRPLDLDQTYLYGELNLEGHLFFAEDLLELPIEVPENAILISGAAKANQKIYRNLWTAKTLADLSQPQKVNGEGGREWLRPLNGLEFKYTANQARLIQIFAVRPFHLLLAGPAGSGKTTLAKNLVSFLQSPKAVDAKSWGPDQKWWPMLSPHSSMTKSAFLMGQGRNLPSELSRLKNGLLYLDELLEFKSEVLESLRNPLDGHELLVTKSGYRNTQQSEFTCVATTNLCPCGEWSPGAKEVLDCRFSSLKCRSYSQKLSGPLADRFFALGILKPYSRNTVRNISGHSILDQLRLAWEFQEKLSVGDSRDCQRMKFSKTAQNWLNHWQGQGGGRRQNGLHFIAENLAILENSAEIHEHHFEEAHTLSIEPFQGLKRGPC